MKYEFEGRLDGPIKLSLGTQEVKDPLYGWSGYPPPRDTFVGIELKIIGAEYHVLDEDLRNLQGKVRITIENVHVPLPDPATVESVDDKSEPESTTEEEE